MGVGRVSKAKDNIEVEGKILNVTPKIVIDKLIGAKAHFDGLYHFQRYVFDTIPVTKRKWVRLRTDGNNTTLAVKEISDSTVVGTQEWETRVDDIDTTLIILEKIGIKPRGFQENFRMRFTLNGCEVCLDFWPSLSPYLEIEAESEESLYSVARKLGIKESELTGLNTEDLYREIGIDLQYTKELKFKESEINITEFIKQIDKDT